MFDGAKGVVLQMLLFTSYSVEGKKKVVKRLSLTHVFTTYWFTFKMCLTLPSKTWKFYFSGPHANNSAFKKV